MGGFSPESYETVDERIQRFYRETPGGRITTELLEHAGEPGKTRWIVKAYVFRDDGDHPAGTGMAFDTDGVGMAQKTAALETAETSAVGRALAQAGYSGSRRTTREEMAKTVIPDLLRRIGTAGSKQETGDLWIEANKAGVLDEQMKKRIYKRNEELAKEGAGGE
ncbi:hypothetical protein ACT3TD_13835 [Corynebacterium sp. AOP36-E1-14]|uniref:hypothetical protein n=1 Tax=Corynebacterium sp. AOP36-E1-14 TaxID=3457682 RepID=UPI004033A974